MTKSGGMIGLVAATPARLELSWSAEHRNGRGELICRHASIPPPEAPKCLSVPCLWRYFIAALFYVLLANYHARRVAYAEANRDKTILERYRMGEPSPATIWEAIHANIKLACPICRRCNADPFLFRR